MSLILVRPEPVKHPYYVDALGVHISSSKELCYVIYNNPLLALDGFVNDHLIAFIRNELGLGFLAEKLAQWKRSRENPDEMLVIILEECYYYTDREISRYEQRLASFRKMSGTEFMKETADYYFSLRQYGTAVHYYEKILEDWRVKSLTDDFTANVWNNIGASYAGIFWFEKALSAYEMSYNFRKDMDTIRKIYQLTLLNPELTLKERYRALISEERMAEWKKELYDARESEAAKKKVEEIEALFNLDPIRRQEGAQELVSEWKKEYRKML
ncbi:MAG: hypothetical protein K6E83_11690 [Clostridium sp.]|nr:hypothetical protein [Clostridium sp.]